MGKADAALRRAATKGRIGDVRKALDKGADINGQGTHGNTALHNAACVGHLEVCQVLIEQGADVLIKDDDGHTAIDEATQYGNDEVAEFLKPLLVEASTPAFDRGKSFRGRSYIAASQVQEMLEREGQPLPPAPISAALREDAAQFGLDEGQVQLLADQSFASLRQLKCYSKADLIASGFDHLAAHKLLLALHLIPQHYTGPPDDEDSD